MEKLWTARQEYVLTKTVETIDNYFIPKNVSFDAGVS